jgi:hypothetical protein
VELTRHAKNQLRWLKLSGEELEWLVANPISVDRDPFGRPRYLGEIEGRRIRVVLALDEPDLVVTLHPRR